MVKDTERATLEATLKMDGKQPLSLMDELNKTLESFEKKIKKGYKLGFTKESLADLQYTIKEMALLGNHFKDLRVTTGKGAAGIKNIGERFRYLADNLIPLKTRLKEINKEFATLRTLYSGTDALINKARISGTKDYLNFGTDQGLRYQTLSTQYDSLVKQPERIEKMERAIQEKLNPALREQRKATEEAERVQKSYNNRLEYTNKVLPMVQLNIMANYAAINKLVSGFKYLLNYTVQYDEELHQLQAISGMSSSSLSKVRDTIESVAMATEFSSLEIAKASTVLAQAGLSATQIQRTLPSIAKLATATGTDLATSTDVITSTLNVYNMQVSEAEHVTNALTTAMNESKATISQFQTGLQYAGNIASQLGVSFEETTAAISAMTQAGIRSKSTLGTGLRAILTEFSKPSKTLITQLEKVGLSIEDIDVRSKGLSNVLKTLKTAGFGVTEALRGMQRRSATALVSLMSQVDFMDELRLKMAGSTAATKANETQMEALAKQMKNFQNVMSNAATQGLEPFIRLLSNLLAILNKMANSPVGKGLLSVLLTGVAAGGIKTAFTMASATIKAITGNLNILGQSAYITGISKTITMVSKFSAAHGKLAATGLILKSLFGGFTGIATIATIIYQIADAMGAFESAGEKAKARLDEIKGEAEELKTTGELIQDFQERLVRDRKRLEDSTEKNIFVREILTRLPEANKLLDVTSASLEDVRKALEELNNVNLDRTINSLEKMAKAAEKALISGIEEDSKRLAGGENWYERIFGPNTKDVKRYRRSYEQLQSILPANTLKNELLDYYNDSYVSSGARFWAGVDNKHYNRYIKSIIGGKLGSEPLISGPIQDLRNYYRNMTGLTNTQKAVQIESLTADADINASFGGALRSLAEEFRSMGELLDRKLERGIKTEFDEDTARLIESTKSSITSFDDTLKKQDFYLSRGSLTDEQSAELTNSLNTLLEQYKALNDIGEAKTYEDLRKAYGYSSETMDKKVDAILKNSDEAMTEEDVVRAIVDSEDKSNRNQLIVEISDRINKVIETLNSVGLPLPANITEDVGIFDTAIKAKQKLQSKAKNKADIGRLGEAIKQDITNKYSLERASADKLLESSTISVADHELRLNAIRMEEKKKLDEVTDSTNKLLNKGVGRIGPKFDTAAASMNKFFKDLDASIAKVETTFVEAEKVLDQVLARQQGRISAAGLVYGKSSVINQYEQNVAQDIEDSQIAARLTNLKNKRAGYQSALDMLRSSSGYQNVMERYKAAEARYDSAVDRGSWNEAREADRIMKELGNANKKYAEEEKKLTSNIAQLDESIIQLDTTLKESEELAKKPPVDQIVYGAKAAMSNYAKQQEELGYTTLAGSVGYMTTQGIDALDSSMTSMFQNILDGSQRAGDAFKDFGKTVIKTLRDVAVQMAVKQGLTMLFSAFGEETPTDIRPSFLQTQAVGGLINGPVKNRDSVPTMLMPGEYVLKKSAVDTIGRDYLDSLNANASATMGAADQYINSSRSDTVKDSTGAGGTVNVYVVGQEQQQSMTPNDVIVTISQDMLKGGQTKKLVKSIAMGSI